MIRNCRICDKQFETPTNGWFCSKDCRLTYSRNWQRNYFKENPSKYLLWGIQGRCSRKGIPFNLTAEDIEIPSHCPILGIPLFRNTGGNKPTGNSPSVDRIVPELGYIKGNIQVISQRANIMKNDANPEELLKFADWVYKNYKDN